MGGIIREMGTWAALAGDSSCGGQARRTRKKPPAYVHARESMFGKGIPLEMPYATQNGHRKLVTSSDLHGLRAEGGMGANLEKKMSKITARLQIPLEHSHGFSADAESLPEFGRN